MSKYSLILKAPVEGSTPLKRPHWKINSIDRETMPIFRCTKSQPKFWTVMCDALTCRKIRGNRGEHEAV